MSAGRLAMLVTAMVLVLAFVFLGSRAYQAASAEPIIAAQARVLVADLSHPMAAAIDLNGDFYIADSGAGRIIKVSILGATLGTWAAQGSSSGQLRNPGGIVVDADFNIYVGDTDNDRIQKFSPTGQVIAQWGSSGSSRDQLRRPSGLVLDRRGNLFVVDTGNNRIIELSPTGEVLAVWATFGAAGQLLNPEGIAIDAQGNIYVADTDNNRVLKFGPDGTLVPWSTSAQFKRPTGLAFDEDGNLYVVDSANNRLLKIAPDGHPIWQLGGSGKQAGQYDDPRGVAITPRGALLIVEAGNNRAQLILPSGASAVAVPTVTPRPPTPAPATATPTVTPTPTKTPTPTVTPTVTPTPTPVPVDERWWLSASSPTVITAVQGQSRGYSAKVGDTFPASGAFEVIHTAGGRWVIAQDQSADPCTEHEIASHQTGDTVVGDEVWGPGPGCQNGGVSTHTWTFNRQGDTLELTFTDTWVDNDNSGIGSTLEEHYTGRMLQPGEPTPTPEPTSSPG